MVNENNSSMTFINLDLEKKSTPFERKTMSARKKKDKSLGYVSTRRTQKRQTLWFLSPHSASHSGEN